MGEIASQKPKHEEVTERFIQLIDQLTNEPQPSNAEEGDSYDRVKNFHVVSRTGIRPGIGGDMRHFRFLHVGATADGGHAIGLGAERNKPPVYVFLTEPNNPLQVYKDGEFLDNLTTLNDDPRTARNLLAAFDYLGLQINDALERDEIRDWQPRTGLANT